LIFRYLFYWTSLQIWDRGMQWSNMLQLSGRPWQLKYNCRDDQNSMKAHPLDDLSFDSTRVKTIMFYEFWPLVIHLEVLQNRERFAVFFCYKMIIFVFHLGWCGVLHKWNNCRLNAMHLGSLQKKKWPIIDNWQSGNF